MPTVEEILGNVVLGPPAGAPGPASPWQETTLPYSGPTWGAYERQATVAAPGVTPASAIEIVLAPSADDDENDPELLDLLTIAATPATDTFDAILTFGTLTSGPIKIRWRA